MFQIVLMYNTQNIMKDIYEFSYTSCTLQDSKTSFFLYITFFSLDFSLT